MDSFNQNTYGNFQNRYKANNNGGLFSHDENVESNIVDELRVHNEGVKETYYRSILNPEAHGSKIPSKIPAESAIAPLKWQFNITPNATGKFLLVIDPFFGTGYLYQSATVDGIGGAGTLTSLNFPQDSTIIDQWRLVSSSLIMKYYGNFNQMAGLFVAATTSNVNAATQTTYLTFNNVEDLSNRQVLKCIDGLKMIYAPMDEKATDFATQTTYSGGTHPCRWQYLFVVAGDAFPNASCIRCDFFRNIEYTSTPSYKEYIPQTRSNPSDVPVPILRQPVTVAPSDFRGGTVIKNNSIVAERNAGYGRQRAVMEDKLMDAFIDMGKKAFEPYIDQNPFNKNAFAFGGFK